MEAVDPTPLFVGVADQQYLESPYDGQECREADDAPLSPEGNESNKEDDDFDAVDDEADSRVQIKRIRAGPANVGGDRESLHEDAGRDEGRSEQEEPEEHAPHESHAPPVSTRSGRQRTDEF